MGSKGSYVGLAVCLSIVLMIASCSKKEEAPPEASQPKKSAEGAAAEAQKTLEVPKAAAEKAAGDAQKAGAATSQLAASQANMNSSRTWKFFRAGGFDQVTLESGSDLMALDQLDQKLWVALACPTTGLHFDPKTLALIDTEKDGRIRAPELIAATKWACQSLKFPDDLLK